MRLFAFVLLLLSLVLPPRAWAVQDVANSSHNLSSSGPGNFTSKTVNEVCVFCHTPHNANPGVPLWNHKMSGATYLQYESSTQMVRPGQPTGKSRLCLSCHDGTVALGALANPPAGRKVDLADTYLTGRAALGTDLSNDHPISFPYDKATKAQGGKLAAPQQIHLPLEGGELQCTTCHDPHEKDIVPFLHQTTLNGELCTTCHIMRDGIQSWETSSHATSTARPSGLANPWAERKPQWRGRTVAENACFNCHAPHNAATPARLIKDREERTCFRCHDGSVAATDIEAEILKPYRHPVDLSSGIHDPTEDFTGGAPGDHVECADCHQPHLTVNTPGAAPDVPGAMLGVKGINSSGGPVPQARNEYEVCYKCHADNNVPATPVVTRKVFETNTRLEFDLANPSFHPVQGIGRNNNVPSLIAPLRETSLIYCTDCHGNDSGPGNGGTAARGPHGSIYQGLLVRNYSTADNTAESPFAYDLCYKCHDRTSILADESFAEHDKHIVGEDTPCSACHDSHGISSIQGNPTNNSHLINFDATIARPNGRGMGPVFEDLGVFRGQCSLTCHGKDHDALGY
ncbi:MAG: cytochrome c3 family protein [Rhodospirillales bacterium]|nr:cytochrome c3 family protein [Rhodospirillales bacterium]